MAEEKKADEANPKEISEVPEDATVVANETLPAEVDTDEVVDVYFDDTQDGITGTKLAGEGRPQLFKLDHKKGTYHAWDDDEERYEDIVCVIVAARTYYRRFGPSGISCESDNGKEGYDQDLRKKIACLPTGEDSDGAPVYECGFSYDDKDFTGNGKCGLGLQMQLVAILDGNETPIQCNMSATSARAFSNYLDKLNRRKLKIQKITTKMSSRHINGKHQQYYAAKFDIESEEACVDVSHLLPKDEPSGEATAV